METSKTNKITLPVDNKNVLTELVNNKSLMATLLGAGGLLAVGGVRYAMSEEEGTMSEIVQDVDDSDILLNDMDLIEADGGADLTTDIPAEQDDLMEVTIELDRPILEAGDTSSFAEVFAAAREELGAGGIFMYRDQYYNTYYKEEWDAMYADDRDQYYADLDEGADYDNVTYIDADDGVVKISIDHDPEPEIVMVDQDSDGLIDEVLIDVDPSEVSIGVEHDGSSDGLGFDYDAEVSPTFDMDHGGFGDLDGVPDAETIEVDPYDIDSAYIEEDTDMSTDVSEVDEDDLADPDEVVDVEADDVDTADVTPDDFLDELFDDNLPEASENDVDGDDLPDPINDADLDDWGL